MKFGLDSHWSFLKVGCFFFPENPSFLTTFKQAIEFSGSASGEVETSKVALSSRPKKTPKNATYFEMVHKALQKT